ncbi:uncharacterized protein BDZ99DRAFT_474380 [Mytilinidion resinicola]|uniref:Uncharacterized protein n=1 Tax=Mytilinidion resinicola TaxID=574789 RepID=A0A6A6YUV6_9PEZI|nr:uncharacterized protein BDZ99DRAFT_474380 [Mytilinidion resinicola]KAF2812163.1 hypothetical protein BDZ99DRAFT_474380 [Mytilinidion resinicola]
MLLAEIFAASAFLSIAAVAAPAPQIIYDPVYFCPLVDSSEEITGTPWQIGLSIPGGDTISVTESHSVSTTWTVGGDLGISAGGLSAGISASVSETVTDSVGEGTSAKCPEGAWHCSMAIVPSVSHVKGHLHQQNNDESCDVDRISQDDGGEEGKQFEFLIPIKDSSGNGKWTYDVCTCGNVQNWADPGHPSLICPEDCTPHDS